MKEVFLVTKNPEKLEEISAVMKEKGISVRQLALEKEEDKSLSVEEIAVHNAKLFAEKEQKPVIVDDTGIYFDALDNFPGSSPKDAFHEFGFDGLLKKVEGKERGMRFKTAAAYCEPGREPIVVVEELRGRLTEKVYGKDEKRRMVYERIFIPEGGDRPMVLMTREEKNKLSHRAKAFRELAGKIKA
ncbi:MAG: hypothetical protein KJ709_08365 [Nanoarchaeota archaeon]|nr:hypothetical protein [Nanoarchaeota archaeon]